MSTINGQGLFNSGPHRFVTRVLGQLALPPLAIDFLQTATEPLGANELAIVQRGRLVDTTTAGLWAQVDAIKSAAEGMLTGTLVDNNGRSWTGMTLLRFVPDDRVDRGRVVSLGYRADYVRL